MSSEQNPTPQAALVAKLRAEMDDDAAWRSMEDIVRMQFATIERLRAALEGARVRFEMLDRGHPAASARAGAQSAWEALNDGKQS
jgi:hypothetical protein